MAAASLMLGLASSGVPTVTLAQGAPAPAPGAPQEPRESSTDTTPLDILEFDIAGNTVLDEATVDEAVYPFLGRGRTRQDVDRARAALEKAYIDRGYKAVSVVIPQQRVVPGEGVVHLQVVEGRVGHLKVVGSKYTSIVRLKQAIPAFAEGNVPNFNDVQRSITQLNNGGDRTVTPSLKAGAAPGTIDVDLLVEDHLPLHATAELNNEYSQGTTPLRAIGTVSYDNLFQLGHSLTLSYQAAPENGNDAQVAYVSYLVRFGASPFSLLIDGFHTGSNVSVQGGTDVIGRGDVGEIKGIVTLASSATSYQALTLGVAYKHFNDNTTVQSAANGPSGFTTPVTYFPLSVGYTGLLRSASAATELDLTATFASPELGTVAFPNMNGLDLNRSGANGQELYLRGSLTRTQELPLHLQGFLRVAGQLSDAPLITNEEYTLGGMTSVRGYVEAETLGDQGVSGTFELRSPQLAPLLRFARFQDLRLLGFVDQGKVYVRQALQGQQDQFHLASFGAGGNLQMLGHLNAQIYWARTLRNGPVTPHQANRLLFRVWGSF
jgi:hemolysin activation/secretion protein